MPRIDPYIKYPEFVELRDQLLHTSYGKDLYSILTRNKLPDGYKLKDSSNMGKFYIEAGSRTYMRKLPDGRWHYAVLTDGNIFHQDWFTTIEKMLRDVWVKILVKRTPADVKRADFEEWLMKPDCPARGKNLDIEGVVSTYLETLGDCYRISERNPIFDSEEMIELFNFLGIEKSMTKDKMLRPVLHIGRFFIDTEYSRSIWNEIIGEGDMIFGYSGNPVFQIRSTPKKGTKKADVRKWGFNTDVIVNIHAETKEGMENEILRIMRDHIKNGILKDLTNDEEVIGFIVTLLTPEEIRGDGMIKSMASYVNKNPKLILKLPERYKTAVKKELGMTDEIEMTIRDAVDYKIL